MRVVPKADSTLSLTQRTPGLVVNYEVKDGDVFFHVIWYGRPGVRVVHHSQIEVIS